MGRPPQVAALERLLLERRSARHDLFEARLALDLAQQGGFATPGHAHAVEAAQAHLEGVEAQIRHATGG